ncbi:hypothetical protein WJX79_010946 [Trebouxia sp. C0005]
MSCFAIRVQQLRYLLRRYEGHLDLAAVSKASRAVEATLSKLQNGLSSAPSTSYRPLEELYLSKQNVRTAGGAEAAAVHDHFSVRAGAEATARNLTLPTQPVQRSPSPAPVITPATAPTGSAPKDATERRSIPSGTSFIPGRSGSKAGPIGRGAPSGAAGANLFMSARPPSRPASLGGRAAVRKAPAGKSAKMLDSTEALNLRAKAAFDHSQRQEQRKPAAKRPAPSEPVSTSAAPSINKIVKEIDRTLQAGSYTELKLKVHALSSAAWYMMIVMDMTASSTTTTYQETVSQTERE